MTTTHPDFLRTLSSEQATWLSAHGIEAEPNADVIVVRGQVRKVPKGWGFHFSRGDFYVLPVAANDSKVYLMARDSDPDSDGERQVATFDRLRDALVALATKGV